MKHESLTQEHQHIARTVQHNCHISDARFAGNYTLCVYLLKMREYYRWEKAHPFSTALANDDVGRWLTEREQLWERIEQQAFEPISTNGELLDPFESGDINARLLGQGLVYSAGIGQKSKPHFFLGELLRIDRINGFTIYVSAREFARDLTSPPAMSQGTDIFIRRESFRRMLWEKLETWRWNRPQNAMASAIGYYDFDNDLEAALDAMTDHELEAAILHEIGEIHAGELLPGWDEMISDIAMTKAEIMARAVRDHLADAISTLPALVEQQQHASIHFYIANLTSMRQLIFPALLDAYRQWTDNGNIETLSQLIDTSAQHWQRIAEQMLVMHREYGENSHEHIEQLVDANYL
jgi:Family of unknown function (DUF6866) C-terminal domain/Family of unknown function (DUF6866) N-terminal domain